MLYKERKTRVMCDFYMLYMKLRKHFIIILPPSATHTRMTLCAHVLYASPYAAWHAHKGQSLLIAP